MKVAIIRLSALGDIIVSAVFLPHLKTLYPQLEIHWFVDEMFGDILDHCPYIDGLHKLPFKKIFKSKNPMAFYRLWKTLCGYGVYDIVIDLQGLIKSALIGSMLKKSKFIGFDKNSIRESLAALFYNHCVHIPYEKNILERNAKLLYGAFGQDIPPQTSLTQRQKAFGYTQQAAQKIDTILGNQSKATIVFVLEASLEAKTYPIEQYAQLTHLLMDLDIKILLLSHHHPKKAQDLFDKISGIADVVLLPKMGLDALKALIGRVDVVIGGDTGVTHLAWAMQKASITLYGNTPMERFKLYGEKNISLSGNLRANYDKNDFSIRLIPPERVAESLRAVL
ncbi:lipopolysaccharide heptosyltransferase I [Helicobacter sp. 12S02634-8]|uniref:lipopolysaccharide heptosyltransferase I n=1 Tax=Helicobacter sp. 12S02634-8 TaxID=1476199 RepID=UPI000BA70DA7|nr:lipopolysaccharide heptosyltransferase I [Helicobacter sp. 12S02634-8]PAF47861.1 lipopolysaccharide heptosyltransferase I [Helicobacter sp. 12S02634-8]